MLLDSSTAVGHFVSANPCVAVDTLQKFSCEFAFRPAVARPLVIFDAKLFTSAMVAVRYHYRACIWEQTQTKCHWCRHRLSHQMKCMLWSHVPSYQYYIGTSICNKFIKLHVQSMFRSWNHHPVPIHVAEWDILFSWWHWSVQIGGWLCEYIVL